MAFQSIGDKVILKLDVSDTVTDSGFVIPAHTKPLSDRGEVVAVGPGEYDKMGVLHPLPVEVGDTVIFDHHAAYGIQIDGEDYVTVPIAFVSAIVRE
jgi:chaperonin GroES